MSDSNVQLCSLMHGHKHGDSTTCYTKGKCRCIPCVSNNSRIRRSNYRITNKCVEERVSPVPTIRRVQALSAAGWTLQQIAESSGISYRQVKIYASHEPVIKSVKLATHEAIKSAYERIGYSLPESTEDSRRAVERAKRRGWAPPMAWDDIDKDPEPIGRRAVTAPALPGGSAKHVCTAHPAGCQGNLLRCISLGGCTCINCARNFCSALNPIPSDRPLKIKAAKTQSDLQELKSLGFMPARLGRLIPISPAAMRSIVRADSQEMVSYEMAWIIGDALDLIKDSLSKYGKYKRFVHEDPYDEAEDLIA